jgi:ABC-2 type transport system permease protein
VPCGSLAAAATAGRGLKMKKYLAIFIGFFRASAIADLEYRANIAIKVFSDVLWYTAQLSVFEVLFRHIPSISGWTLESTRVFMGMLFVVDACWMLLFSENLDRLSDKVRRGDLDLLLAKPVNSQFMMSLQKMNTAYLGNIGLASAWLIYALSALPGGVPWDRLLVLVITVPSSLTIIYSMRFMFSTLAVIFTRAENITYVWYQFYRLGTRPDALYPPWLRYVILSFIPVGFLASVPSRLILQSPDVFLLAASIGLAVTFLFFSNRFWKFALRRYSSASS